MENKNDILKELQELSPTIAAIEKTNVFTVPDGYFEYLSADILKGIKLESGVNIKEVDSSTDDVPVGYFDSLSGSILSKIKAQETEDAAAEIKTLSPMLYSIQNENVFEVPAGYFANIADEIVAKVQPQAKVVKMQSRGRTFLKYAVAAVFTGAMALTVFKFTAHTNNNSKLPDYVVAGLKVQDVDQELAKISDAEIVKFLEASGTDVNAALVANSIDDNELPAQEDYLLDEKALDNYLNSINLDELN